VTDTADALRAPADWRALEPAIIRLWRLLWVLEGVGLALLAGGIASRVGSKPRWGWSRW